MPAGRGGRRCETRHARRLMQHNTGPTSMRAGAQSAVGGASNAAILCAVAPPRGQDRNSVGPSWQWIEEARTGHLQLFLRASRGEHTQAGVARQLDGGGAHAAARGVHDHGLARAHVAHEMQQLVRGEPLLGHGRGLRHAPAFGNLCAAQHTAFVNPAPVGQVLGCVLHPMASVPSAAASPPRPPRPLPSRRLTL